MPKSRGRSKRGAQGEALPFDIVIYYGRRRILMAAPTFVIDREAQPYRRLSATLFVGCRAPFQLDVGDGVTLTTRAALLAPKVRRRRTVAVDSHLLIFDLPIGSPEFAALEPTLASQQILSLDYATFAHLEPTFAHAFDASLSCDELDALFDAMVQAASGRKPAARPHDPRVVRAMALIDELRLDEVSLAKLAKRLALSSSRLRHLFQEETGCTVTHYARFAAVWKAALLWKQGMPFTQIAHEVGFYDLAHLTHAFIEAWGVSPSAAIDPRRVTLVRCG